jgi:hypothetical protein
MNQPAAEITSPATKAAIVWATAGVSNTVPAVFHYFGITTWAEAAQFAGFVSGALASTLTCCYLVDWFIKRVRRPLFVAFGWAKPPKREQADE